MVNGMKKYIVFFVLFIVIVIGVLFNLKDDLKLYNKDLFYMDTYINIKIYCNNEEKALKVFEDIENIYKDYHILTDRYNEYEDIYNIYKINNNNLKDKELVIDEKLYNLLKYSLEFDNELFDINLGGVIDVWKKYRDRGYGIPNIDELKKANKKDDIILLDNNKIKNNNINIDLGAISKGYTTQIVGEYLKKTGIDYFLINAGGNVLVGKNYKKDYYKIGVENPNKNGGIVAVIKGENISVVSSGGYLRNYVYDGKLYHHIISPKTLFPTNYMKSVTVVTFDSALGDMLSTTLFLMDIESGKEFIKKYDAEAIWVDNNDNIIKSEGFYKYE